MTRDTKPRSPARSRAPEDDRGDHEEALRILLDDDMMKSIARIGRFRVLAQETLVAEPPDPLAGHRISHINLVDYTRDRTVLARVDLDLRGVASLSCAPAAATLAPEEEAEALAVALADRRVAEGISLGDAPQAITHIGTRAGDLARTHRSAAVVFGTGRSQATLVAVVDLARRTVIQIVPAERWQ